MKVAVIAPTAIPARRANTIQVMKMSQALVEIGHDLSLYAPQASATPAVAWEELARFYGLHQAFPLEYLPARPSLRRYDYAWQAIRRARHWQADLVYTRLPQAAALASTLGIATVFEVHDLPRQPSLNFLFKRFLNGRGRRRLVAITKALANDLSDMFNLGEKTDAAQPTEFVIVAPDGVDLERYAGLPAADEARQNLPHPLQERFTVGYTGHLYPGRGIELLFALAESLSQINFILVGGEPETVTRLQAQAASRHLENLTIYGFVPNANIPAYQAACDALLMPYQHTVEASSGGDIAPYLSPMKLFEYMASGRAIVSSDLPVLREVLSEQNAVLLPPDDLESWQHALLDLQAHPEKRSRLAIQARDAVSHYTWTGRARRIINGIEFSHIQAGERPL